MAPLRQTCGRRTLAQGTNSRTNSSEIPNSRPSTARGTPAALRGTKPSTGERVCVCSTGSDPGRLAVRLSAGTGECSADPPAVRRQWRVVPQRAGRREQQLPPFLTRPAHWRALRFDLISCSRPTGTSRCSSSPSMRMRRLRQRHRRPGSTPNWGCSSDDEETLYSYSVPNGASAGADIEPVRGVQVCSVVRSQAAPAYYLAVLLNPNGFGGIPMASAGTSGFA